MGGLRALSLIKVAGNSGSGGLTPIPNLTYLGNVSGITTFPIPIEYNTFDVNDFSGGVVINTGINDARPAILAAIAAMSSSGGILYFPSGTYLVSNTITITKSVRLVGVNDQLGSQFVINTPPVGNRNGGSVITGGVNNNDLIVVSASGNDKPVCSFENLSIISNATLGTQSAGAGIVLQGFGQKHSIRNCTISGFYICVDIQDAFYWDINGCWIGNPVRSAIRIQDSDRIDTCDSSIHNCQIISGNFITTAKGVEWISGGGLRISDCKFDAQLFTVSTQFQYAIWCSNTIGATSDIQLSNLSIEDFQISGIYINAANRLAHILINNVQIAGVGSTGPGIDIIGTNYLNLTNFIVRDWAGNSSVGLRFTNCLGVTVDDGYVTGYSGGEYSQTGSIIDKISFTNGGHNDPGTPTLQLNIFRGAIAIGNSSTTVSYNNNSYLQLPAGDTTHSSMNIAPGILLSAAISGAIENDGNHLYYTDSTNTRTQLDRVLYGASSELIYNNGSILTGSSSLTTNGTSLTIGTGSALVPLDINILRNTAGLIGFGIQNTNTTGNEQAVFIESLSNYGGFGRFNTAVGSSWVGTSISQSDNSFIYSGPNNDHPLTFSGAPIFGLIGHTGTNLGFRQDIIGLRVGQIQNLHNVNTVALQVDGVVKFSTYGSGSNVGTPTFNLSTDASGNIIETSIIGIKNYTHSIFTPSTGNTVNLINNQYNIINPTGTLAALTVNLPSSPVNNDVVYIKYTQAITTVTYGNGTVVDGITAPTAGNLVILVYDSGTTSWY